MSRILLALLMLQAGGAPTGSVTGIVRTGNGIPAVGVRVYAQQVRDTADANSPAAPLEGIAQTDASGRYRIELPAGRYYIASGAVSSPTYYPGTTNVVSAKPVLVTAGGLVEGIDFGRFVAAGNALPPFTAPPPPGSLSGTVQYPDGKLAGNVTVTAFPSTVPLPPAIVVPGFGSRSALTDSMGRYRIEPLPANIYYIVAGFAETPGFYTAGTTQPKTVLLSQGASIPGLDFTVPLQPARTGTTISGHVLAKDGAPAFGATVRIVMPRPAGPITNLVLPSINAKGDVRVGRDGTFTFSDVVPGYYNVQVFLSKANQFDSVVVGESPVTNLRLSLPAAVFSGQILLEDGRAVPDPELFVAGVLSTVGNSNTLLSTSMLMSAAGTFEGLLPDNNEYRFYLRNLPEEYEVRSLTADAVDLLKETLKIDGTRSIFVEARVAPRGIARSAGSVRVVGTALDSTGSPSPAARVHLCCLNSSSLESISTPLQSGGSFEFSAVPPGSYTVELRTGRTLVGGVIRANVDANSDWVKVQLISAPFQSSLMPVTIDVPKLR